MTVYVALLRGVNVGGHGKVRMADLCAMLTRLKFAKPRALLQSGNLVFEGTGADTAAVERKLEAEIKKHLALDAAVMVRKADEIGRLAAANPFVREAEDDPARLHVFFLKSDVTAARVAALQAAIKDREIVRGKGGAIYAFYPDGMGRSRLTTAIIEKSLGTQATARNWNTVLKLQALAAA